MLQVFELTVESFWMIVNHGDCCCTAEPHSATELLAYPRADAANYNVREPLRPPLILGSCHVIVEIQLIPVIID